MSNPAKISIIIPFFGQSPGWMDYFLLSCKFNPDIFWLLFTDFSLPDIKPDNLRSIPFSLNDFNQLATRKIGIPVQIKHPYKICDLKPAYGDIFEEYIQDSMFWGYGDMDLFYGNIRDCFPDEKLKRYDILSNHADFVTGHFCILRNTPRIRKLYRSGGTYKKVFTDPRYRGFDEQLKTLAMPTDPKYLGSMQSMNLFFHIRFTSLMKIPGKFGPMISSLVKLLRRLCPLKSIHRRIPGSSGKLKDFTSIVTNAGFETGLRIHFKKTFQSDLMLRKMGEKSWSIKWDRGNLYNEADGQKLLYFHFIMSKSSKSFTIDPYAHDAKVFTITKSGIRLWEKG